MECRNEFGVRLRKIYMRCIDLAFSMVAGYQPKLRLEVREESRIGVEPTGSLLGDSAKRLSGECA